MRVLRGGGFDRPVGFAVSAPDSTGISSAGLLIDGASAEGKLPVAVNASVPPGDYLLTVRGSGEALSRRFLPRLERIRAMLTVIREAERQAEAAVQKLRPTAEGQPTDASALASAELARMSAEATRVRAEEAMRSAEQDAAPADFTHVAFAAPVLIRVLPVPFTVAVAESPESSGTAVARDGLAATVQLHRRDGFTGSGGRHGFHRDRGDASRRRAGSPRPVFDGGGLTNPRRADAGPRRGGRRDGSRHPDRAAGSDARRSPDTAVGPMTSRMPLILRLPNRPLTATLFVLAIGLVSHSARAVDELTAIRPAEVRLGRPVDYQADVAPFLDANCVACHNGAIDEGRLSLEGRAAMLTGGKHGPSIVPGRPDDSLLYLLAAHARKPAMPPAGNDVEAHDLTPHELGLLRQWITEGASESARPSTDLLAWQPIADRVDSIHAVAVSPAGDWAAAGRANQVELYDLVGGRSAGRLIDPHLASLTVQTGPLYPHGAADRDLIHAAAFSPDGRHLATGGYRVVKLWRRGPVEELITPTGIDAVDAAALSRDGTRLVLSVGRTVRLLDAVSFSELTATSLAEPVRQLAFAGVGSETIVVAAGEHHLFRWDVETGRVEEPWPLPPGGGLLAAGGSHVAFGCDGRILLRDLRTNDLLADWPAAAPAAFSADGAKLAMLGSAARLQMMTISPVETTDSAVETTVLSAPDRLAAVSFAPAETLLGGDGGGAGVPLAIRERGSLPSDSGIARRGTAERRGCRTAELAAAVGRPGVAPPARTQFSG